MRLMVTLLIFAMPRARDVATTSRIRYTSPLDETLFLSLYHAVRLVADSLGLEMPKADRRPGTYR